MKDTNSAVIKNHFSICKSPLKPYLSSTPQVSMGTYQPCPAKAHHRPFSYPAFVSCGDRANAQRRSGSATVPVWHLRFSLRNPVLSIALLPHRAGMRVAPPTWKLLLCWYSVVKVRRSFLPSYVPKTDIKEMQEKKRNSIDFRLEKQYYYLIFIITSFQKGTFYEWKRNYYSTE